MSQMITNNYKLELAIRKIRVYRGIEPSSAREIPPFCPLIARERPKQMRYNLNKKKVYIRGNICYNTFRK